MRATSTIGYYSKELEAAGFFVQALENHEFQVTLVYNAKGVRLHTTVQADFDENVQLLRNQFVLQHKKTAPKFITVSGVRMDPLHSLRDYANELAAAGYVIRLADAEPFPVTVTVQSRDGSTTQHTFSVDKFMLVNDVKEEMDRLYGHSFKLGVATAKGGFVDLNPAHPFSKYAAKLADANNQLQAY
jgi:hypothetical protein